METRAFETKKKGAARLLDLYSSKSFALRAELNPLKGIVGENATMVGCHPLVNEEEVNCHDFQTEKTAQNDFENYVQPVK